MNKKQRAVQHKILSVLIVTVIGVWCLAPLAWIFITSVKPMGTEYRIPVEYWPSEPTLDNYRTVLGERFTIQRSILNSAIVSTGSVIGTLTMATLSAYAIARLKFRYRIHTLYAMQIAGMIPPIVVIAPTFVMMRALGLLRTYWAMILPNMVYALPLSSFLIASYFANVPFELEDAAKIDGAGTLKTIFRIVLPIAAPGIFSAGVLAFLGSWGEFMLANTVTIGSPAVETVPVAIQSLSRAFNLQWSWVAAGTVVTIMPIIIAVLVFQRVVVTGLSAGGVK
ncbi:MAG: carbohydrate ABC transporter permease [Spirochaetaceae bacterium]|nr:MAG: carbohydrate ABC transporter permease [Spirochaetaceae bacterium]